MGWTVRRYWIVLALSGCGSSLSSPDGGTGAGGSGGRTDGAASEFRTQLDEAAAHWAAAKSSCGTYSYDRRTMSVFGSGTSTEVEIRDDVPTRRRYSTLGVVDGGSTWTVVWDETGTTVGEHTSYFAASTMEQLLAECATILAHDPAEYFLTLQISTSGVPWVCTNFPRNCADDCESGIRIQNFLCEPLPATHP